MLPPALRFDLRPRRALPWLKPALILGLMALAAAEWWWLYPRQAALARLQAQAARLASLGASAPAGAPATPPASWRTAADQDGQLFALTLEPRLTEIERCTDDKTVVTRLSHDESSATTQLELTAATADDVSGLVSCLNTGSTHPHRWRLAGVEAPSAPAAALPGARRVVLKRD